jgi:hypothetical protein
MKLFQKKEFAISLLVVIAVVLALFCWQMIASGKQKEELLNRVSLLEETVERKAKEQTKLETGFNALLEKANSLQEERDVAKDASDKMAERLEMLMPN